MYPGQASLLLFDIGNTGIKVGLASEGELLTGYTLRTDAGQTSDDLGLKLLELLRHAQTPPEAVRACLAASVVPGHDQAMREMCRRYFHKDLLFAPEDLPIPLLNRYERPAEVGADRLVGAYAARKLVPETPSLICVDFGTALTFDCVTDNAYLGGLIFPGVRTAALALAGTTAKLPHVSLEVDGLEPVPGRSTVTSIKHGIMFGYAALVEGLCARLARQLPPPAAVLATGGFAQEMHKITGCFSRVVPGLLLEGLRLAYLESRGEADRSRTAKD
ncbi:MAG: type III pantothenate kinase [Deltaproteobacteria bacterium]|jgi:type III pantothenate kinase|nr:type III pantothenate kinase [Deltaproteobacteria bacterium]